MSAFRRPSALTVSGALLLAVLTVGLCFLAASPRDGGARLAAVSARLDRFDRARPARTAPAYPESALCVGAPAQAADALKERVRFAASASGLDLQDLDAVPAGAGSPVVTLKLRAAGRYDAVLVFLAQMAQKPPALFIDSLDLQRRNGAEAGLDLQGRLLCSSPAR